MASMARHGGNENNGDGISAKENASNGGVMAASRSASEKWHLKA
jgi:hypothetical protein